MKKFITYFLSLTLLLLSGGILLASNIETGDEIIITEPVDGNQYLAAGKVKVRAPVDGDLIAAAGEIWVEDSIRDDIILAAGNIVINGYQGGDLRVMGGSITVKSDVWGDLVVTGGEVEIEKGVVIYGDLIVAGGEVYCGAIVEGQARVVGGSLTFTGLIRQKASLRAEELNLSGEFSGPVEMAAREIDLNEGAMFRSSVNYWRPGGEMDFEGHLAAGVTPNYDVSLEEGLQDMNWRNFGLGMVWFTFYRLLAAAVLIVLLVLLFNGFFTRQAGEIRPNWLPRLAYGAALFLGLPILSVIAMITVIGIPAGLMMLSVWGLAAILGHGLTATVLAYEWEAIRNYEWNKTTLVIIAAALYLLLKVIGFIPIIGGLINFVLTLVAFGHVIYALWNQNRREPAGEEEVV